MPGRVARTFEELQVYQPARELTNHVYQVCRTSAFSYDRSLVDQVRRASVSIMSNIAEGFERGSKTEFMQFLYIAKGSCGEVRAQLQIAADHRYITSQEHAELAELCRNISKMISSFIAHQQGSAYRGEKFARPQRLSDQAAEKRHNTLRAAQLQNMTCADNCADPPTKPSVLIPENVPVG